MNGGNARRWLSLLALCAAAVPLAGRGGVVGIRAAPAPAPDAGVPLAVRRTEAIQRARAHAKRRRGGSDASDGSSTENAGGRGGGAGGREADASVRGWASLAGPPDCGGGGGGGKAGGDGARRARGETRAPRAAEHERDSCKKRPGRPELPQRAQARGAALNATAPGQPGREESRYMTAEVRRALKRRRRHYSRGSMMLHQSLAKATNVFDLLATLSGRSQALPAARGNPAGAFPRHPCCLLPRALRSAPPRARRSALVNAHAFRPSHTCSADDTAGAGRLSRKMGGPHALL